MMMMMMMMRPNAGVMEKDGCHAFPEKQDVSNSTDSELNERRKEGRIWDIFSCRRR